MKCIKCNAVLESGSKFCNICGAAVNDVNIENKENNNKNVDNNKTARNSFSNVSKMFLLNITDKVSSNKIPFIQRELVGLSEEETALISVTTLKNAAVAGILEFFWWGLGRLYIGQVGLGIVLAIVDFFCCMILIATVGAAIIFFIPIWIICIVSAISATKEENYKKIIAAITRVKFLRNS